MPFIFIIFGAVLLVAGIQDTQGKLWTLVKGDFGGNGIANSYLSFAAVIFLIGLLGYVPKMRPISIGLMTLILLVVFLKAGNPNTGTGGGVFSQLSNFFQGTNTVSQVTAPASTVTEQPSTTTNLPALTPLAPIAPFAGEAAP